MEALPPSGDICPAVNRPRGHNRCALNHATGQYQRYCPVNGGLSGQYLWHCPLTPEVAQAVEARTALDQRPGAGVERVLDAGEALGGVERVVAEVVVDVVGRAADAVRADPEQTGEGTAGVHQVRHRVERVGVEVAVEVTGLVAMTLASARPMNWIFALAGVM